MTDTQMTDETDELIKKLEGARNFMVGITFDQRLHPEIKQAVNAKADDLDSFVSTILARYEQ